MLISDLHKFIFISNPKTGTSAIQKFLMSNVEDVLMNQLPESINGEKEITGLDEHIKTKSLKKIIEEDWSDFKVFTFVRNPYNKAVSTYFFYKNGKPITRRDNQRYWVAKLNVILARFIPFSLWSLLFPLKTNEEYLFDEQGKLMVDYVGRTECLEEDLTRILNELNISVDKEILIDKANTSSHKSADHYFKFKLHDRLFKWKYKNDFELYEIISKNS